MNSPLSQRLHLRLQDNGFMSIDMKIDPTYQSNF